MIEILTRIVFGIFRHTAEQSVIHSALSASFWKKERNEMAVQLLSSSYPRKTTRRWMKQATSFHNKRVEMNIYRPK